IVAGAMAPKYPARVRDAARGVLKDQGDRAVQSLIDSLAPVNAAAWVPILDELSPYWRMRNSGNPYYLKARQVSDLVKRLAQTDGHDRYQVIYALGAIGPAAVGAVPDLRRCLAVNDSGNRAAAADALGMIGPAAADAVPDLVRCLADTEYAVRLRAGEA